MFAGTQGFADNIPKASVKKWEGELVSYLESNCGDLMKELNETKNLNDALRTKLKAAYEAFNQTFVA
jgi:F-type H+-transporting ATPase subunit alpha